MPHHNELVTRRRSAGLDQEELAFLFDITQPTVSRLEAGDRHPSTQVLVASHLAFGAKLPVLFPDLYREVADALMRHAAMLERQLRHAHGPDVEKMRRFLEALPARVSSLIT